MRKESRKCQYLESSYESDILKKPRNSFGKWFRSRKKLKAVRVNRTGGDRRFFAGSPLLRDVGVCEVRTVVGQFSCRLLAGVTGFNSIR